MSLFLFVLREPRLLRWDTVAKDVTHFRTLVKVIGIKPEFMSSERSLSRQASCYRSCVEWRRRDCRLDGNTGGMIFLNGGKPWPD